MVQLEAEQEELRLGYVERERLHSEALAEQKRTDLSELERVRVALAAGDSERTELATLHRAAEAELARQVEQMAGKCRLKRFLLKDC